MEAALNTSVFNQVILAIGRTTSFGSFKITLETKLAGDLTLGGLSRIRLAMCLEDIFDIELADDVLERFVTVGDIVKYVGRRYFRDVEFVGMSEAA